MEDQQSDSGDLTDVAPEAAETPEPVESAESADPDADASEAETAVDSEPEAPDTEAEAEAVGARPGRRPVTKGLVAAAAAAAALFVGAGAFAGAAVQPYLMDRVLVDTKENVARTAANAITTLWTYTPEDMDKLPDRSAKYLGGDFESDYRKYIDAIASTNKQAQVSNSTQVLGAAVESLTPTEATAVVYTNTTSTSPLTKDIPSLRYLAYRLSMKRHDADWLITKMTTITSLDLTPKL